MDDSLVFVPIRKLGELVRTRRVSPVELAETFLGRLETLGPAYNAVVTLTRERALAQARRAENEIASGNYRGPLHGIPYGAKDLLATSSGIPTTWGATQFRDQTFDYDATVVRRLEDAGAVLVAKLAMMKLAAGMGTALAFTGPGINPWDLSTWSGGSSSGSGSAVSAGLVPFAIGSETWGSILSPANNCGVAGLRPTYGRVSRYGAMALCWSLDKLGPLCLTADDCGLVLEAIAGPDPQDPSASGRDYSYDGQADLSGRRLKLGVLKNVSDGAQHAVRANFERSLRELEQIATIEETELPDYPYQAVTHTILNAEADSAFDEFIDGGGLAGLVAEDVRYGPYARTAIPARDYLRALRLREIIARQVDAVLARYDALVAPASPRVASPLTESSRDAMEDVFQDIMGAIGNGAGLPAIAVPNGFSEDGLPTGIQFMGRAYEENSVIAAANAYQSLTDFHLRHPPDLIE